MPSNLPNIWDVCTFSDEIIYGKLDMSKFAVDFHSVIDGTADEIYMNPKLFLEKTFPSINMKNILKDALLKLGRNEGQSTYIIDIEFGGGKTHTLLLLYHIFRNPDLAKEYIHKFGFNKEYGILEVPNANVVAIDCSAIKKKTLWGEIALLLGKYDDIKEFDENYRPIDLSTLKSFFDKPVLLLIDELPVYLLNADSQKIGNVPLSELTINFILNLIRAVSSMKNCMLILTLTARQRLYEKYSKKVKDDVKRITDYRVDELRGELKEAVSRQAQFIVPLNKEEVYSVIVTRLIKKRDENKVNEISERYYNYYEDKGLVTEPNYRDKIVRAYPFSPFLIDTLYERVSTIDEFNKTRGLLRLLARVLHSIYRDRTPCTLVGLGSIALSDEPIADELTSKIGREDFKPVIASDCIQKAREIDKGKNVKLVEPMARAIYLYSLIGSTKISGIKPNELKLAVCHPDIDPSLVDTFLIDINKNFWYIKDIEGQEFYFDKKPNINKIIEDYMKEVKDQEIRDKIRKALEDVLGKSEVFTPYIWDESLLPDNDERLKLFVLDYEDRVLIEERLSQILERTPNGNFRTYQNTLVFIYPEYDYIDLLKNAAKRVCATEKAIKDERIKIDKDEIKKSKERHDDFYGELQNKVLSIYSNVGYPDGHNIRTYSIPFHSNTEQRLMDAVTKLLRDKGKLVESLSTDAIDNIVEENEKINVKEVYNIFRTDRRKRFIINGKAVIDAIKNGVRNGIFGYSSKLSEEDGRYIATIKKEVDIDWDGWVIKKDLIAEPKVESITEGMSVRETPLTESRNVIRGKSYRYIVICENIDELERNIHNIHIITLSEGKRSLYATFVNNNGDKIIIESALQNVNEMTSLLGYFKTRYKGGGTFTIESEKDLQDEFKKYNIKPESSE